MGGASPGERIGEAVQPLDGGCSGCPAVRSAAPSGRSYSPGGLGETALPSPFVKFVPFVVSAVGLFPPCPLWLCESKSGTHVLTEAQRHRGRIRDGTRTSGDAFPPDRNPVILSKIV